MGKDKRLYECVQESSESTLTFQFYSEDRKRMAATYM